MTGGRRSICDNARTNICEKKKQQANVCKLIWRNYIAGDNPKRRRSKTRRNGRHKRSREELIGATGVLITVSGGGGDGVFHYHYDYVYLSIWRRRATSTPPSSIILISVRKRRGDVTEVYRLTIHQVAFMEGNEM
jgi:hypothetical protein